MTPLDNFRKLAAMWFAGKLNAVETRKFVNILYGYLRELDMRTDEEPSDASVWAEYRDVTRLWNSLVHEQARLSLEMEDRVGPTHKPSCSVLSAWITPSMEGFRWSCCACDHTMLVEYRVIGPAGETRDDCHVQYRAFLEN